MHARQVLAALERDVATIESAFNILATSEELASGDLRGFHGRARAALVQGVVHNYVLTDPMGRQVLNTLLPYGTALPEHGTPPALAAVFIHRSTVLTGVFKGPVTQKPVIAIGVPVTVDDKVVYSLNIGLSPDRITEMAQRYAVREGWLVAVLDDTGTIVGRSRDADQYVGQPAVPELVAATRQGGDGQLSILTKEGIPVLTSYASSATWGWSVAVGAPRSQLLASLMNQVWRVVAGMLIAVGLGVWIARNLGKRVLSSVRELNDAAIALGKGDAVTLPKVQFKEAEAVGHALLSASAAMQRAQFLAQHDSLTELPNRLLFDEAANRALSLAARNPQTLGVLALDLDGFKAVNDSLGHAMGDAVLKEVAQRLQGIVRGSDVVARVGGDEFVVLLIDVSPCSALETDQRMVQALSQPYVSVGLPISASVGVATYPRCGTTIKALLAGADLALYQAKANGKRQAVAAQAVSDSADDSASTA
jgi:diguanylate cyclase (GGDEF)-like protein